jgi:hypothetical protein
MAQAPPGYQYVKGAAGYRLMPIAGYQRPNSHGALVGVKPGTSVPVAPPSVTSGFTSNHVSGVTPTRPMTAPRPGYRWVQSHGRWVQILLPKPKPGAAAPGTGVASAQPGVPAPADPAAIDPRDPDYQREVGQAAFERDRDIAEQERQRTTLASQYNRGVADMRTAYDRDRYDSNADLARRGIVRSGEYQKRGADRLMQQTRTAAGLEQTYGTGAQSQIAATLANINQQYALRQQAALSAAKQRYAQNYVASPYVMGGQ